MISLPVSLLDHVATLCAYLSDYRNELDSQKQSKLSTRFSTYLLSLCWPKMHSRITSWPFVGLIHNICDLTWGIRLVSLQKARDQHDWLNHRPGLGDKSLAGYLAPLHVDPILQEISQAADGSIEKLIAIL
jgi:hypothetical protein